MVAEDEIRVTERRSDSENRHERNPDKENLQESKSRETSKRTKKKERGNTEDRRADKEAVTP